MQITTQVKLLPTLEQIVLIKNTLQEYIKTANNVVSDYVSDHTIKHTSKTVSADLPSALKNQAIQDAKSIFKKYTKNLKANAKKEPDKQKEIKVPILKKPVAKTQNGSSDLRIYSGDEEIPYAMVTEQDFTVIAKSERAEILNQGKDAQGNLQFEVLIPTSKWVRQLTVISSDKNFIRRAKVEGSLNQRDWLTLTEDSTIFDLTDEQKARHLEVNLAPTNFPYLRITIYNEGKGTFHLDGVNFSSQNQTDVAAEKKNAPILFSLKAARAEFRNIRLI